MTKTCPGIKFQDPARGKMAEEEDLVQRGTSFIDLAKDEPCDNLSLYEIEGQILTLHDHLVDLRLEHAILKDQLSGTPGFSSSSQSN